MDIGESAVDAVVAVGEPRVVDPHQMQDRRVEVIAIGLPIRRPPGPGIALAVCGPLLDAGTGEPGHRRATVVVPAGRALGKWLAAELGAEDDQGIIQQTTGFQVAEQGRDRPVDAARDGRQLVAQCRRGCPSCS